MLPEASIKKDPNGNIVRTYVLKDHLIMDSDFVLPDPPAAAIDSDSDDVRRYARELEEYNLEHFRTEEESI